MQIQTKCVRSSTLDLRQTSTGILSNLPPVVGTPIFSDDITPASCSEAASGSSTPRLSLMALAKREAARRGLYSKFFRGPILGPEVHSETVETEATAVSQTVGEDIRVGTEKRSKNNDLSRDASTEDSNNEAKKQEKLRKKAEKAAKKLRRRKGKEKDVDEQDVDETITLSAPQEQVSKVLALETPHEMPEKRKNQNKRRKVTSTSELETPPFERTLTEEDCKDSKASRKKRRRRDESL
jgi:hypothetical protein